eukprot:gene21131-28019_t
MYRGYVVRHMTRSRLDAAYTTYWHSTAPRAEFETPSTGPSWVQARSKNGPSRVQVSISPALPNWASALPRPAVVASNCSSRRAVLSLGTAVYRRSGTYFSLATRLTTVYKVVEIAPSLDKSNTLSLVSCETTSLSRSLGFATNIHRNADVEINCSWGVHPSGSPSGMLNRIRACCLKPPFDIPVNWVSKLHRGKTPEACFPSPALEASPLIGDPKIIYHDDPKYHEPSIADILFTDEDTGHTIAAHPGLKVFFLDSDGTVLASFSGGSLSMVLDLLPDAHSYLLKNPVYTKEYAEQVKEMHKPITNWAQRMGYMSMCMTLGPLNRITGYSSRTKFTEKKWLNHLVFMESVLGCAGMVGAMLRHMHSLRSMERDHALLPSPIAFITKITRGGLSSAISRPPLIISKPCYFLL